VAAEQEHISPALIALALEETTEIDFLTMIRHRLRYCSQGHSCLDQAHPELVIFVDAEFRIELPYSDKKILLNR
jgi:hypothetical protein